MLTVLMFLNDFEHTSSEDSSITNIKNQMFPITDIELKLGKKDLLTFFHNFEVYSEQKQAENK